MNNPFSKNKTMNNLHCIFCSYHSLITLELHNWFFREIFPLHVKVYVQNDAVAALASGTMGKLHGCVLVAGTGCIAYGFSEDGKEARAAGGGPILGDWGRYVLNFSTNIV